MLICPCDFYVIFRVCERVFYVIFRIYLKKIWRKNITLPNYIAKNWRMYPIWDNLAYHVMSGRNQRTSLMVQSTLAPWMFRSKIWRSYSKRFLIMKRNYRYLYEFKMFRVLCYIYNLKTETYNINIVLLIKCCKNYCMIFYKKYTLCTSYKHCVHCLIKQKHTHNYVAYCSNHETSSLWYQNHQHANREKHEKSWHF